MISGPGGQVPRIPRTTLSAVKVLVHSLSFFVVILRRGGGGDPGQRKYHACNQLVYLFTTFDLIKLCIFLEFHIADGGSMGDVGRGRGNTIKLASSTGHDIVQVTGHAFTRVRTLIFFFRDRSWDGYRPVSDFVDISVRARWGKLLLLEEKHKTTACLTEG